MAMNRQRRTSNLNNIVRYDTSGNVSLPAGLTVEGLDAGFVKSDANGLFSIDTGAYLPTPSQSGNAGKYLTTDGSVLSWGTISTANIYNSNGTLTADRTVSLGGYALLFSGSDFTTRVFSTGRLSVNRSSSPLGLIHIQKPANSTEAHLFLSTPYPSSTPTSIVFQNNDFSTTGTSTGVFHFDIDGQGFGLNKKLNISSGDLTVPSGGLTLSQNTGTKLTFGPGEGFRYTPYDFDLITNNITRARFYNSGNIVIGTSTPIDAGFKLDVIGPVRLYPRGVINGGFEFTFNDVYNILHSNTLTYISGGNYLFIGGTGVTMLGTNKNDALGQVTVGYQSWQGNLISSSAIFDIRSSTQGFLRPRMTTTQRDAIATPATGLSVYNTTTNTNDYYNGTSWISGGINIYNSNGSLTGNRVVTMGSYTLSFDKDILVNGLTIGRGNNQDGTNTAVGASALAVSTAVNNTAFGYLALQSNTTGTQNTALGRAAGAFNQTGSGNVYIGVNAGIYATTGGNTIVGGGEAGGKLTTGGGNTLIGYRAGGDLITGERNTIIGGFPYADVTTSSASNNIIIADGIGSIRIRAFSTGNVSIGGSTDSGFKLDVQGSLSIKMPSYNSFGFQLLNADGNADWQFYNNGNNPTNSRPYLTLPRWGSGTPILIGNGASSGANYAIGIGQGGGLGNYAIAIGTPNGASVGTNSIVIGSNVNNSGTRSTLIGNYGANIGNALRIAHDDAFAIGNAFEYYTTANYQGILSAVDVYIGRPARSSSGSGNAYQGTATSINGNGGYGVTDSTGGALRINGGVGLGSGTPGDVIIGTATATSSGTTIQTLTDRVWIKGGTGNIVMGSTTSGINNYTEIAVNAYQEPHIYLNSGGGHVGQWYNAFGNIGFQYSGTNGTNDILYYNSTTKDLDFSTNGSQRIRIGSTGNVLIGTTFDAGQKLQVNGVVKAHGTTLPAFFGTELGTANWISGTSCYWYSHIGHNSVYTGFGTVTGPNIESPFTWFYNGNAANGFDVRAVDFGNDPRTGISLFTVRQGGNVGVGTNSPSAKLTISDTSATNDVNKSMLRIQAGDDVTLGPLYLQTELRPSATDTNRRVEIFAGDNTGYRNIVFANGGGNILIGSTANAGSRLQVYSASADSHLVVWGTTSPSIRIDNASSGATQRFVLGLATATNNFITGAVAGDICLTTQSSSPLLFGANATEAMRVSISGNILIKKTSDGGQPLQVNGKVNFASLPTSATGLSAGDLWNNGGVINIV